MSNALVESVIGLYKTERARTTVFHTGPPRTIGDVEFATASWDDPTGTTTGAGTARLG